MSTRALNPLYVSKNGGEMIRHRIPVHSNKISMRNPTLPTEATASRGPGGRNRIKIQWPSSGGIGTRLKIASTQLNRIMLWHSTVKNKAVRLFSASRPGTCWYTRPTMMSSI